LNVGKEIKMRRTKYHFLVIVGMIFMLVLAACGPQATPELTEAPTAEETEVPDESSESAAEESADLPTLRMALIPVLDVLPFFIAQENGYFAEEGVAVEFLPVSSALEREQLMAAGEIDGMLTDVIGPAITNAAEAPSVKIVAMSRRAYEDGPLFRILAGPTSGVETAADLAGINIGISENSVIQYLGDRLLTREGLEPDEIIFESVPSIPSRFSLMMEGQLGAAILPDPLGQAAIEAGAILVLDDTVVVDEQLSQSVLSFSNTVLEDRPEDVSAFLRAWYRAVEALNANPDDFRQLWLDNTTVPESVQDTYVIPPFPMMEITSEAVWDDVNAWLLDLGIIEEPAAYADSVDPSFLPEE
jgi:NitT/TauT family transport system substrate-binding protein